MAKKRKSKQIEDDGDEFTVEQLLAKKVYKGKTYFLIKWENYQIADSTWEESGHVFCNELIETFTTDLGHKEIDLEKIEKEFPFPYPLDDDESDDQEESTKKKRSSTSSSSSATKKKRSSSSSSSSTTPTKTKASRSKEESDQFATITGRSTGKTSTSSSSSSSSSSSLYPDECSIEKGDVVEEILGCKIIDHDTLSFYVKWKGKSNCSYVKSKELRYAEPQLVIDFYEARIQFEKKT